MEHRILIEGRSRLIEDLEFLRFAPQLGSYDAKLKEVRDRAVAILEALQ